MKQTGTLTPNGVTLEPHEYQTILALANAGYSMSLIPPSNTPHNKRADFVMNGMEWEMKSPTSKNSRTLERIIKKACHQSRNIIIDLRRIPTTNTDIEHNIDKLFLKFKSITNLWIIKKDGSIITRKR